MPHSGLQHTGIGKPALVAIRVLALVAATVAGYLTWVTLTHGTVAACGDQSSTLACDDVLRSSWSRVAGIPVSLPGLVVYVSILLTSHWMASVPKSRLSEWATFLCLTLIAVALGSAIWFLCLQLFVIQHICPFCLIIHLCGIVIAVVTLTAIWVREARRRRPTYLETVREFTIGAASTASTTEASHRERPAGRHWPIVVALFATLGLILIQVLFPAKTHEVLEFDEETADAPIEILNGAREEIASSQVSGVARSAGDSLLQTSDAAQQGETRSKQKEHAAIPPQASVRRMKFLKGRLEIDVHDHGLIGSPEAELIAIELVDYTCPDCRRVHQNLKTVRKAMGNRFAVIVFPVPLETTCNPYIRTTHNKHLGACKYANLALSVLAVSPERFAEFHDWLMDAEHPPPYEQAVARAKLVVGPEHSLQQVKSSRLKDYVRLFSVAKIRRLPAMIVGDRVMIGVPKSSDDLLEMFETSLRQNKADVDAGK